MKLLIGVPILSWTHDFAMSFLNFWTELMIIDRSLLNIQVAYKFIYRKPIHIAHQELAETAINTGCTHLLLMDDDIYDLKVSDLLQLIQADKDAIGGLMHSGNYPFGIPVYRRMNPTIPLHKTQEQDGIYDTLIDLPMGDRQGIQPVDLISFGFMLIKTSVFEKIDKPWFQHIEHPTLYTDSHFADRLIEKGIQMYCHWGVMLNHRGMTVATQPLFKRIHELLGKPFGNVSPALLLTEEEMKKHKELMYQKMIEAKNRMKKVNDDVKFVKPETKTDQSFVQKGCA